jgi:hypothetical protein
MEFSTPAEPLAIKRSAMPNINECSFGLLPSDSPTMTPGALTDRHGPWSRVMGACFVKVDGPRFQGVVPRLAHPWAL